MNTNDNTLAENGLPVIITLLQAYAVPPAQVDCRPDFHATYTPTKSSPKTAKHVI